MFADDKNSKCERFISRHPCRGAIGVDAFADSRLWSTGGLLWCVPPPSLLCRTLAWMRGTRTTCILGLPYWTSHPVFTSLFPPHHSPPFVKDYIMYPEGSHVLIPGEGARAPATMRSYRGSIKKLRDFAIDRGLDPSCPTSLIIYSLQKVNEGKALSTLRTLSAAFTHFVSPPPPILSQILSNIHHTTRRLIPVAHHAHVPREHIDCLIQYATNHPEDLSSLRTAVGAALSFSALLRLLWSSGYLRLTIRRAKNDQFSEGRNTFVSIVESSPTFSLFHAYKERVPSSVWVFPSLSNP
ncbi:hypothetical protein PFISCL1PPCAC_2887, partial [Pristionchus fissidentatus]